jgi:hypothetical protein
MQTLFSTNKKVFERIAKEKVPIIVITTVIALLVLASWNHYGLYLSFDQTKELYILYLLTTGEILYRDFVYYYGPLMPYLLSSIMKFTGFHLNILYSTGIIITITYSLSLYGLSRFIMGSFYSTLVVILFLVQIAFINQGNYIFPYSYNVTVASMLFIIMTIMLICYLKYDNQIFKYVAAGLVIVSFYLKQDFFISFLITFMLFILILPFLKHHINLKWPFTGYFKKSDIKDTLLTIAFIIIAIVLLYLFLGIFTGFNYLNQCIFPFGMYKSSAIIHFIDNINRSSLTYSNIKLFLIHAILSFAIITAVMAILYAAITGFISLKSKNKIYYYLILVISTIILFLPISNGESLCLIILGKALESSKYIYSGINIWLLITLIYFIRNLRNNDYNILLVINISALIVSYRMFMNLELYSYSLYYLPISLIMFVYLFARLIPDIVSHINMKHWQITVQTTLILLILFYGVLSLSLFNRPQISIESFFGTHYIFNNEESKQLNMLYEEAASFIKENTSPDDRILSYPGGVIIYLYSERKPGSRHYHLFPTTVPGIKAEQSIIEDIKKLKPEYILISNEAYYRGYNTGIFGSQENNPDLYNWIISNYSSVKLLQADKNHWYKIEILKKFT